MNKTINEEKKFEDFEEMYRLCKIMQELAGAPKEELSKRQPGERQASEIYGEKK